MVITTLYDDDQVEIIQIGTKVTIFYTEAFILLAGFSVTLLILISSVVRPDIFRVDFYINLLFGLGAIIFVTLILYSDLQDYLKFKKSKKAIFTISIRVPSYILKYTPTISFQLNSQELTVPLNVANYEHIFNTDLRQYDCIKPFYFSIHVKKPLTLTFNSEKVKFFLSDTDQNTEIPNRLPRRVIIHFKKLEVLKQ